VRGLPAADPRITSFKGIPFAAPPVGDKRWHAPEEAAAWEGVKDCYTFKPIAMQARPGLSPDSLYDREWHVDGELEMSEDCLYLNVWTPAKKADEKLPVYVWYFGGGLQVGYPSEMEFDGERLARRGVVVVTVNYRVNAFGFLCHAEISKENPEAPANFGHLDQQFATQWVKRNIAAFGGNPENITIGGQSAGGGSVLAQLASPQNKADGGLFQKASIMSGLFTPVYPGVSGPERGITLEDAQKRGEDFFKFCGAKNLAEARKIPADELLTKMEEFVRQSGRWMMWGSVADGKFMTGNPYEIVCEGKGLQVPLMVGNTVDEFFAEPMVKDIEGLKEMAERLFMEKAGDFMQLLADAGGASLAAPLHALKNAARVNGIEFAARFMAKNFAKNGVKAPFYYYQFGPEMPGWDKAGCFHSSDLWFFFETLAKCWRPWKGKHYELARQMCNYWAEFIRDGNPNGTDADGSPMPQWEAYTDEMQATMYFGETSECCQKDSGAIMKFLLEYRG
jgi:para-nitrobenzyl esterase